MQRRHFTQALALMPLAAGHARLFAAPAAGSRFLLVFQRGGCDSMSVLAPVASSFYYESRPNIAIARPSDDPTTALAVDADWGLHPALRDSIGPLLARKEVAFVPFAGTDDLSRSHFETQDTIERGQPLQARHDTRSGFMARLAAQIQGCSPIAFTDQLPLAMQGGAHVDNVSLRAVGKPALDPRQSAIIASMYRGSPLEASVEDGFALRTEVARKFAAEMQAASRNAASAKGFELEARRIARLMRDRYTLGFVDVGGWDTHIGQGAGTGYLANRLDELGRGLAAFAEEMGPIWRDTTVVVLSEFGRTFRENGNRGTDHGHGGVMWVMGGETKRAPVLGEQVANTPAALLQNRDWPVLNDWRGVLGEIFTQQFALDAARLQSVFPQSTPTQIGVA